MKVKELIKALNRKDLLDLDVHLQIDEYSDEYLLNAVTDNEDGITLKSF